MFFSQENSSIIPDFISTYLGLLLNSFASESNSSLNSAVLLSDLHFKQIVLFSNLYSINASLSVFYETIITFEV